MFRDVLLKVLAQSTLSTLYYSSSALMNTAFIGVTWQYYCSAVPMAITFPNYLIRM